MCPCLGNDIRLLYSNSQLSSVVPPSDSDPDTHHQSLLEHLRRVGVSPVVISDMAQHAAEGSALDQHLECLRDLAYAILDVVDAEEVSCPDLLEDCSVL